MARRKQPKRRERSAKRHGLFVTAVDHENGIITLGSELPEGTEPFAPRKAPKSIEADPKLFSLGSKWVSYDDGATWERVS